MTNASRKDDASPAKNKDASPGSAHDANETALNQTEDEVETASATTTNDDTDTMSTNSAEDASTSDTYTDTSINDILTLIRTMNASAKNSLREQLENEGF